MTASTTGYVGASVTNFPATQPVSGYLGASVANFPTTVTASVIGYIGASITNGLTLSGEIGASVANWPTTQQVYVASSVTQSITIASSSVQVGASVSNFPATQAVSGYWAHRLRTSQPRSQCPDIWERPLQTSRRRRRLADMFGCEPEPPANIGSVTAFPAAAAAGGASPYHFITGASYNNVNVKSSAGTLYSVTAMNVASNPRYRASVRQGYAAEPRHGSAPANLRDPRKLAWCRRCHTAAGRFAIRSRHWL